MTIAPIARTALHAFIADNLEELVSRVRNRRKSTAATADVDASIRLLFARIIVLLKPIKKDGAELASAALLEENAVSRANQGFVAGLTIAQVVHAYGDICQVVTELAVERAIDISAADFHTFNACLDNVIADAVTEYSRIHDRSLAADGIQRSGELVHELRNVIGTAMLSFDAIKGGAAGTQGSVSKMHTRSLTRLRDLVDRSFSEARLDAEILEREQVPVSEFIEEAEVAAVFRARAHNLELFVATVDAGVLINVDRQMIAAALANLLQNAFKFSRPDSLVSLTVKATEARVLIEVQDECGGLPPGKAEELFLPFKQRGENRSGLGLGLSIARRAVEANRGELRVVDLPKLGCRFTIDLPRFYLPTQDADGAGSLQENRTK